MEFTREPIIETVISAREGCRILIRNSKTSGQEEFVVDALEIVNIGTACFFRNRERPKAFLVPATDYEIIEVRDTRLSLKAASFESSFKAGPKKLAVKEDRAEAVTKQEEEAPPAESRPEKRRERKKGGRRRRSEESASQEQKESPVPEEAPKAEPSVKKAKQTEKVATEAETSGKERNVTSSLLPPPATLIKDEINRLRQDEQYKGAFYAQEEQEEPTQEDIDEEPAILPLRLHEDEPEVIQESDMYMATPEPDDDSPWSETTVASEESSS